MNVSALAASFMFYKGHDCSDEAETVQIGFDQLIWLNMNIGVEALWTSASMSQYSVWVKYLNTVKIRYSDFYSSSIGIGNLSVTLQLFN